MKNPKITFAREANMYCVTYWDEKGNQKQKWFSTYEEAYDEYVKKLQEVKKDEGNLS